MREPAAAPGAARAAASETSFLHAGWNDLPGLAPEGDALPFDPLLPERWTVNYDHCTGGTMSSWAHQVHCARRLSSAAIQLHVALGLADADTYLRAFDGRVGGDTVRALASGQASAGDPAGARAWADRLRDPVDRAYALLGIGEGLLPREATDELPWWQAWD